jgi:fructose-specific phosphotransferase system IIC component
MTPEEHNKWLGIAHLAYGAFYCLFVLAMMIFMGSIFWAIPTRPGEPGPPAAFFLFMMLFMLAFYAAFIIPSFFAGYALLRRRRWAKVMTIIAGVLAAMFFPIGTALCVYTFWFLFSEPGRKLYDKPSPALPPPPPHWRHETDKREYEYAPPAHPTDWR